MGKNAKLKEKQTSRMKSYMWITHENCEGPISLARRKRNSREQSRMLVRNWKTPVAPATPCKIMKKNCASGAFFLFKKNKTCMYSGS